MIDHKIKGYLAETRSAKDLATGIKWILDHSVDEMIARNARQKVLDNFTEEIVSSKMAVLYRELLNKESGEKL